jgi:hypothetical protein
MFRRWFLDHPQSLGESYGEHQRAALAYSVSLALAAIACFIHAIVPCLFERTASQTVTRLYENMRARTKNHVPQTAGTPMPDGAIRVTRTHHSG